MIKIKENRIYALILFLILGVSSASIVVSNNYVINQYGTPSKAFIQKKLLVHNNIDQTTGGISSSEVPSFLIRYKDNSGIWYTGKFAYDKAQGKWILQWSHCNMWPGGIEDTDNDGNLEDYTYYIENTGNGYRYTFYRIDDGTGDIIWSKSIVLNTGDYYRWAQFEDFNNDGIKEVVFGKQFDDKTTPSPLQLLILNSTNGGTLMWYDGGTPQLWSVPVLYDYNDDGIRDIAFYGWPDNSKTYLRVVSFKDFNPTVLDSFDVGTWGLSKNYIADFDNDGEPEWLVGGWGSSYWTLYDTDHSTIWSIPLEGNADGNYLVTDELLNKGWVVIGTGSYGGTSEYIHLINISTGEDVFPKINIAGNSYLPANAVFDLNRDGNYEILTMVYGSSTNHMALIDTSNGTKLWELDNYNVAYLPGYYLSNNGDRAHSFIDFDNDGMKDIINIDRANGDVLRFYYDGHVDVLGNLITDNNLDADSSTMDYAMIYKAPIENQNEDWVYIDENNQLWINTTYYQWRITNDSALILKTGTEPRNVSIYPATFLHHIDTQNPGSYHGHEYTQMNIIYNDGNKAIIQLERKMLYTSAEHEVFLRMNLTVEKYSGLIKLDNYIYNPNNYDDVYSFCTQMQLITGGDESNDYYYYSGATSANPFPYSSWDEIMPSEVTPYNDMMYITMYDTNYRQGVAMFANYSDHGDHWSDVHYGSTMEAHGVVYAQYNKIGLFLSPTGVVTYYILFYTTDINTSWKPVETAIDNIVQGQGQTQDTSPPNIYNIQYSPTNPTEYDQISISCTVTDDYGIQSVNLNYRINGSLWQSIDMTYDGSYYTAIIGPFGVGTTVEFYISATDTSGNVAESESNTFTVGFLDTLPPNIYNIQYNPTNPTEYDQISISCTVTDDSGIHIVNLYYRIKFRSWLQVTMIPKGSTYSNIIGPFGAGTIIEFYIEAIDTSGNRVQSDIRSITITTSSETSDNSISSNNNENNYNTLTIPFAPILVVIAALSTLSFLLYINKKTIKIPSFK